MLFNAIASSALLVANAEPPHSSADHCDTIKVMTFAEGDFVQHEPNQESVAISALGQAHRNFRLYFSRTPARVTISFVEKEQLEVCRALSGSRRVNFFWSPSAARNWALGEEVQGDDASKDRHAENELNNAKVKQATVEILPHEIGHIWFSKSFDFSMLGAQFADYGAPAPDWLDELAAQLMEPESSVANDRAEYHRHFANLRSPDLGLRELLTLDHPVVALIRQKKAMAPAKPGQILTFILSDGSDAAFYQRTRAFGDYLIARSNRHGVLGSIAENYERGRTFEDWLGCEGQQFGLPTSVEAMELDWIDWYNHQVSGQTTRR